MYVCVSNLLFVYFVSLGKNSKTRFTVVKCLSCGQSKTLLNNPDYCLWVDRPEAQMVQQKQPGDKPQHYTHTDDDFNKNTELI